MIINGKNVVLDETGAPLVCYGCGHSAGGQPFPSWPSGERPCLFCIRNPNQTEREQNLANIRAGLNEGQAFTARYDNGPTAKEPADQYIATDRLTRDLPPGTMVFG